MDSLENEQKDFLVVCHNNHNVEIRGSVLRSTRHMVVFEIYSTTTDLQLSEVLSDLKIQIGSKVVYSGRAVVSNLVNTGTVTLCEASLDNFWLDVDLFSLAEQKTRLRQDFREFLEQWQKTYRIGVEYKVVVADLQSFLIDLRQWLEQLELAVRSMPTASRAEAERKIIAELGEEINPAISSLFEKFEILASQIEPSLVPAHRSFCRKQLHPIILCSPFMHRIYTKPLGYAGDYEMVNMILRDPMEGSSLLAKMLNVYILNQVPAVAHRNRVTYLTRKLQEETNRMAQTGKPARILNLGCGPAKEVQNFLQQDSFSHNAQLTLLDFNDETLMHTGKVLEEIQHRHNRSTNIQMVKRSVQQILKQAGKPRSDSQTYDFIYCAGLFDYLSDKMCRAVIDIFYDMLAPGGLLVTTNVEALNPIRNIMEYMFEWHLIYRNSAEFSALIPSRIPADRTSVVADYSVNNLLMEIRKSPKSL
jgi:extracellular factor (EF) 3-hydroxypalmitic acid methyl ester biosynthesis protein